jgi:hypothetical protein
MERTEVDCSSNSEPGGRCPSRPVGIAWMGIELLGFKGLQDAKREGKEAVADQG